MGRQPTSASLALGSSPYLLPPNPAWNSCRYMNQRKCEPRRCAIKKKDISIICKHAATQLRSCAPRGSPTIKWNQDGGARAGKIQAFSTPPPSPLSKDTDGICLIRDNHQFLTSLQGKALQMWSRLAHEQHVTCHFFNKSS